MSRRYRPYSTLCLLVSTLALICPASHADGASRVTFQPSYSGSCENCSLVGQQMPYSDLSAAHYSGANLSHASLFGCSAQSAQFGGIIGRYADFSQAQLSQANLESAILTNARFVGANANGADFSGAQLDFSVMTDTMLIGANLADATATHIKASKADFSAINAPGAVFDYANLRDAVFDGAQLQGASFAEADLAGAKFRDTRLAGSDFSTAKNFEQADFTGACRSADTKLPVRLSLRRCTSS